MGDRLGRAQRRADSPRRRRAGRGGDLRLLGVDGTQNRGNQTGFRGRRRAARRGRARARSSSSSPSSAASIRIRCEFGTATLGDRRLSPAEPVTSGIIIPWASRVRLLPRRRRGLGSPPARGRRAGAARRRGPSAEAAVSDHDAAERAARDPVRGSLDADRARLGLVSRRLEERAGRPDRLRAPLRAHDVQGLEERRARVAHVDHRQRRRTQQRLHDRGRDGLLADAAGALPAAGAVARSRSDGHAAHRRRGVPARARGGQGRAADARGEPAVRPAVRDHLRPRVHDASVQAPDDRQHGGPRGGVDRRRARFPQHLLRARERHGDHRRRLRHRCRRCRW